MSRSIVVKEFPPVLILVQLNSAAYVVILFLSKSRLVWYVVGMKQQYLKNTKKNPTLNQDVAEKHFGLQLNLLKLGIYE